MTLKPYPPSQLDDLAWRFFDLAADLRKMARECQRHGISSLDLHDKKPLEWLAKLQDWSDRAGADLEIRLVRQRASQAAHRAAGDYGSTVQRASGEGKADSKQGRNKK